MSIKQSNIWSVDDVLTALLFSVRQTEGVLIRLAN